MKKIICVYKKNYTAKQVLLPDKMRRRKIPVSTFAAVFKLYIEKCQTINIMYNAFDDSEAAMEARSNALEGLIKRLKDFNLSHRFDIKEARNELARIRSRT